MSENDNPDLVDLTSDPRKPNGQWAPGNSGGGGGRPKTAIMRQAMLRYLEEHPEAMTRIVAEAMAFALGKNENRFGEKSGVLDAAAFIRDTVDGKPKQAVELSGEDGGAIGIKIIVED